MFFSELALAENIVIGVIFGNCFSGISGFKTLLGLLVVVVSGFGSRCEFGMLVVLGSTLPDFALCFLVVLCFDMFVGTVVLSTVGIATVDIDGFVVAVYWRLLSV